MLPNGEPNAVAPKPRRRSWLSKTLTAAMLACFAVGGLFASQAAFKANGSVTAANSVAYSSPVAPPTGQAIALTAPSSEPQYLTKNVEDVQEGDYVLARDEHGHEIGYRKVVEVYRRTSFHLRHLKFRDAHGHCQTLSTTDEHPFLDAEKNQFVNAGDMPLCTKVTAPNGELQTLVHTKREDHPEGIPVFNFQVEGFHTYYVHQPRANVPVLVHNADKKYGFEIDDGVRRAKAALDAGQTHIEAQLIAASTGKKLGDPQMLPISKLRSPKESLSLATPTDIKRWERVVEGVKDGVKMPPITVRAGSKGVPIGSVFLD